jgi:SNF2 family DNA or RNA helicase
LNRTLYRGILMKDKKALGGAKNRKSLTNILLNLRKCCNHPYLFDGVEPEPYQEGEHLINNCGKMILLDKLLLKLKAEGHRVLIFSQMTSLLDILQDYMHYREYNYERLDGSVRGEERYSAISRFTSNAAENDTFVFLLSTRAGGVGLNLVAADVVIFMDQDFNPQMVSLLYF